MSALGRMVTRIRDSGKQMPEVGVRDEGARVNDKNLSAGATVVAAWGFWLLAVTLVTIGWAVGHQSLGQLGIVCAGAAATLHVRSFLCKQATFLREAFDCGVEYGKAQAQAAHPVTKIPAQPGARNGVGLHQ